jgi:hypothetical protein
VTALPGLTPKLPEIMEGPVLVTVVPASTANDAAVPSPTGAWAAAGLTVRAKPLSNTIAASVATTATERKMRARAPTRAVRGPP